MGLNDGPKIYKPHKNYELRHVCVGLNVCVREFTFVVPLLRGNMWINFTDTFYYFIQFYNKRGLVFLLIVSYCSNNVPSHI